jgi:hypothetical protein
MMIRLLFSLLLICGPAAAQYTRGYVYVAPGGISAGGNTTRSYQIGGGVERLLVHGIGAGADLSGLIPGTGRASNSVGIFSLNGYYHPLHDRKADPFVTAGYSLMFRDFTANMFNFGGGVNYWFQENLGLMVEFRDHYRHVTRSLNANYWGFRIGLTFR